jgi:cyclase
MLKKRLIFVLYFDAGSFFLSRNFRLQKVGDVRWLVDKFRFKSIGRFIDEIVVLDVSRDAPRRCDGPAFSDAITYLMKETFVPLTIGGGLRTIDDATRCMGFGADKILLNSPVLQAPELVRECVARFGAQAVIAALDCYADGGGYRTKINNAETVALAFEDHLQKAAQLGVGEIMVNSIDRDGTGMGFDAALIQRCLSLDVPLIVAGGAGKPEHFADVLSMANVEAAATGNLFNFIGKGFELVRRHLSQQGFPVRYTAPAHTQEALLA